MKIHRGGLLRKTTRYGVRPKMKKFTVGSRLTAKCGLCALLTLSSGAPVLAADSATLNFTGTIVAGTCDLTAPPTVALGDVDPEPLVGGHWKYANLTSFQLTITNCVGVGGADLTPGIRMTGTPLTGPGVETVNKWVFKDGGDSTGFGVVLYSVAGTPDAGTDERANNDWLDVPNYGKGTTLPSGGATVTLKVAVSCGRDGWCARQYLKAGSLNAALTFTFKYH
ncbi:fimbrial protein [Serratia liquefaciens]|uniref:fimbrial protein n=1 Tax=Serratia liquefaciens TaxID=614 RepID=UPI00076AF463|nr:fimbrial protein [Serratia liquefaciens]